MIARDFIEITPAVHHVAIDELIGHISAQEMNGMLAALSGLCVLPEGRRTSALVALVIAAFARPADDRVEEEQEVVDAFSTPVEVAS